MKLTKLKKILSFFDKNQKRNAVILLSLMFIASMAELFGLGMIILMINSFLGIENNLNLPMIGSLGNNLNSINNLLVIFFLIFTSKYIILILAVMLESDFIAKLREKISYNMFKNFLNRDSSNLLKKNSAEYLRNFVDEINLTILFFSSLVKIILDLILFCLFVVFLIIYNPIISSSVIAFFSIASLIYFILIKEKIARWSKTALENKKKKNTIY